MFASQATEAELKKFVGLFDDLSIVPTNGADLEGLLSNKFPIMRKNGFFFASKTSLGLNPELSEVE